MSRRGDRIFVSAAMFLAAVAVAFPASAGDVKVGGGGAAMNTVFLPVKSHAQGAIGVNLVVLQSTPKDGLVALLKGEIDAAAAAVPLESMIAGAEKDGMTVDKAALRKVEVATNRTVLFVHKDNPVSKLTKEQVKGIFTGRIGNWKDVGGKDKEIVVVWGKATPGQNALLTKEMLDGAPVMKETLEATNYVSVRQMVAANPEAVGIDPLGMADGTVNVVETDPPMPSPIIVVTKGEPSGDVAKLLEYLKGDGKKHIRQ